MSLPSRLLRLVAVAALAGLTLPPAAGCAGRSDGRPAGPATRPAVVIDPLPGGGTVIDRVLGTTNAFYLDVYHVNVPLGAVARNDEFWRRVDEERLGPETRDLLQKNGLRAGVAASEDWPYFRELIEQHPNVARSGSAVATGNGTVDLIMRQNVRLQDIFLVRGPGGLSGRTYEKCDDLFEVGFWPNPRRANEMQVTVAPVVRSTRTVQEFTVRNEEKYLVERKPESLYELNFKTVIPTDRFLVLGLYGDGGWPTSLGNQFLTLDGGGERKEQVLVFVPRLGSRQAPAATRSAPVIDAGADER
ncbi:MAG: hypothetical protein JWO31_4016 [Phycisphaerales bacterium]|nr:hypothetical protein [Phycisphaerales bacterium]